MRVSVSQSCAHPSRSDFSGVEGEIGKGVGTAYKTGVELCLDRAVVPHLDTADQRRKVCLLKRNAPCGKAHERCRKGDFVHLCCRPGAFFG